MDSNLHSPERRLIELRIEHADLDAMIDRAALQTPLDELMMRRLKKRRLALRDEMARIARVLTPNEPAWPIWLSLSGAPWKQVGCW